LAADVLAENAHLTYKYLTPVSKKKTPYIGYLADHEKKKKKKKYSYSESNQCFYSSFTQILQHYLLFPICYLIGLAYG
jgi:hypothetical protein